MTSKAIVRDDLSSSSAVLTAWMEINTVEQIVRQRIGTLDYIKKTASGRVHWMNVMKITPSDIRGTFDAKHIQKRSACDSCVQCCRRYARGPKARL